MKTKKAKKEDAKVIVQVTDDAATSLEKLLKEELPEEVRLALEAMRRVQRLRRTVPAREAERYRYFQIA